MLTSPHHRRHNNSGQSSCYCCLLFMPQSLSWYFQLVFIIFLLGGSYFESFLMLPSMKKVNLWTHVLRRSQQVATIQSRVLSTVREDRQAPSKPLPMLVSVDREILSYLGLNRGKSRILISTKSTSSLSNVKRGIESRFKLLEHQPYKLRYRVTKDGNSDLQTIKGDKDILNAINAAVGADSSLQVYVQVNPGVFPPVTSDDEAMQIAPVQQQFPSAASYVHRASVEAMRTAHIDPADSDSYTMVSFYGFHRIADPDAFAFQLESLWKPYHSLGRVYVAREGVNAQMAIPSNALPFFEAATRSLEMFRNLRLNTDHSVSREEFMETKPFRALHVRAREQILSDGFEDNLELDWTQAGLEMPPLEWHRQLSSASSGDSVRPVVLDCRNSYESDVGVFEGAVPLNTTFFRESWPVLEDLLKHTPKDAPILTYCTGGIRCVKVNAYLQQKMGFTNTHRLQGGIIAYNRELAAQQKQQQEQEQQHRINVSTEAITETPLSSSPSLSSSEFASKFKGVNYVFDERIAARITEDVLTSCELCAAQCDQFTNCANFPCNVRFIQCAQCGVKYGGCCSLACSVQLGRTLGASYGTSHSVKNSNNNLLSRSAQRSVCENQPAVHPSSASSKIKTIEHAYNRQVASDVSEAGTGLLEALAQYCESNSETEPPLLSRLREETLTHYASAPGAARMLCDPLQGRLLAMLVTITNAKHILELGAFTGYSAICLALGLEGEEAVSGGSIKRKVVTCEPDAVARGIAGKYIADGGLQGVVDLRSAAAMSVIESLGADPAQPPLDLVFLDADKKQYAQYIQALMGDLGQGEARGRALLRDGALIVVDNTLWKGLVLDCTGQTKTINWDHGDVTPRMRALAESMHSFNAFVAGEPRLQQVMLPLRDGISIIRYSQQGSANFFS